MKQSALKLVRATRVFDLFRRLNRGKALILTYHRFSENEAGEGTSAELLEDQIDYLCAHYQIKPLSEMAYRVRNGLSLQPYTAAITIDDGYADSYRVAFPILRKHRVPATLFVVTDFLDCRAWLWTDKTRFLTLNTQMTHLDAVVVNRRLIIGLNGRQSRIKAATQINSLLKRLPDDHKEVAIRELSRSLNVALPNLPPEEFEPLTWEAARQMDASGVEIASHTVTHPILTNVSESRLTNELAFARDRLQAELRRNVDLFCYPNGVYDERVRRAVGQAGYRCAVTTKPGLVDSTSDPLALERIHTESDLTHFIQSTSGFELIKNSVRRIGSGSYSRPKPRKYPTGSLPTNSH
jgi:peptidoglycan/xylan/chitin deacetylase (PgdA/CDA1 family)